jgi:hypothetical protein
METYNREAARMCDEVEAARNRVAELQGTLADLNRQAQEVQLQIDTAFAPVPDVHHEHDDTNYGIGQEVNEYSLEADNAIDVDGSGAGGQRSGTRTASPGLDSSQTSVTTGTEHEVLNPVRLHRNFIMYVVLNRA